MDWSALVSLLAVLVTGLTVWIGYRDRGSVHRQAVYQKQMEASSAVLQAFWQLVRASAVRLQDQSGAVTLKREEFQQLVKELRPEYLKAYVVYLDNLLYLPGPVATAFTRALHKWPNVDHERAPSVSYTEVHFGFVDECFRALGEAQSALGIEPLSAEIVSIVSRADPKGEQRR